MPNDDEHRHPLYGLRRRCRVCKRMRPGAMFRDERAVRCKDCYQAPAQFRHQTKLAQRRRPRRRG